MILECPNCTVETKAEYDPISEGEYLTCPACRTSFTFYSISPSKNVITSDIDLDYVDQSGQTLLHWAASSGKPDLARKALTNRENPNVVDGNGFMPLHLAASENCLKVADVLLEKGAILEGERPNKKDTPLHWAVKRKCSVEAIKFFLRKGGDPNVQDRDGQTPLHKVVALPESKQAVKTLLENGADPDIENSLGATPLHVGVSFGRAPPEVIKLLLDNGADASKATEDGFTPIEAALQLDRPKVVGLLENYIEHDRPKNFNREHLELGESGSPNQDTKTISIVYMDNHPRKGTDVFEGVTNKSKRGDMILLYFDDGSTEKIDTAYVEELHVHK